MCGIEIMVKYSEFLHFCLVQQWKVDQDKDQVCVGAVTRFKKCLCWQETSIYVTVMNC